MLVAFEGIDGSGKGTQAHRLHERLVSSGRRAELISFPRYESTLFGKAVGEFLNGRFGSLSEVNPFLVSLLYAGDRFESRDFLKAALDNNDVVVLDRYVASNMAHQGAKCTGDEHAEIVDWIEKIEYGLYEMPQPDLVFLLDLPAAEAQRLIEKKQARSYTEKKADLQEADAEYLESVRRAYLELSAASDRWQTIDLCRDNAVRPVDEIGEAIWERLSEFSAK